MNTLVSLPVASAVPVAVPPMSVSPNVDPIFEAIQHHKKIYEHLSQEVTKHSALESELPLEKRQSEIITWGGKPTHRRN